MSSFVISMLLWIHWVVHTLTDDYRFDSGWRSINRSSDPDSKMTRKEEEKKTGNWTSSRFIGEVTGPARPAVSTWKKLLTHRFTARCWHFHTVSVFSPGEVLVSRFLPKVYNKRQSILNEIHQLIRGYHHHCTTQNFAWIISWEKTWMRKTKQKFCRRRWEPSRPNTLRKGGRVSLYSPPSYMVTLLYTMGEDWVDLFIYYNLSLVHSSIK